MYRKTIILCCAFLLLGCSSDTAILGISGPDTTPSASPTGVTEKIELTKIGRRYEFGKSSFRSTAILSTGKMLAVGYDGEDPRRIRISADGKTWATKVVSQKQHGFPLSSIYFVDDRNGWIVSGTTVYRTIDGGESWTGYEFGGYLELGELSFSDNRVGYLAGKRNIEGEIAGEIWRTIDGGQTWRKIYSSSERTTPFALCAVSKLTVVAVFGENNLVRTDDGGKTWQSVEEFAHQINQLVLDKNGKLWAVGAKGAVMYSSDSGSTWKEASICSEADCRGTNWKSIAFADAQQGFVVGSDGMFAATKDGGQTWSIHPSNLSEDLLRIAVSNSTGIITGSDNVFRLTF